MLVTFDLSLLRNLFFPAVVFKCRQLRFYATAYLSALSSVSVFHRGSTDTNPKICCERKVTKYSSDRATLNNPSFTRENRRAKEKHEMCLIRNDLEPEKHAFENKNEGCYRNSKTPQHHNWPKVLHCIWARILLARIPESFVLFDVSQRVQVSLELRFKKPKEGRRKGPPVMAVEVHEGNIRQIFKASQLIGRDCHIR